MKKQSKIIFIVAIVLTVLIVVGMVVFLVVSKQKQKKEQQNDDMSLLGAWQLVAIEDDMNGSVTFVSGQFAVFGENTVTFYSQGTEQFTSHYKIGDDGFVQLTDRNTGYFLAVKTSNYFKLWENEMRCQTFAKYPNDDLSAIDFDVNSIQGRWNVTFHDKVTDLSDEYWLFENGTVNQYANGGDSPIFTGAVSFDDNTHIKTGDISYVLQVVSDNDIILILPTNGAIIELKKA